MSGRALFGQLPPEERESHRVFRRGRGRPHQEGTQRNGNLRRILALSRSGVKNHRFVEMRNTRSTSIDVPGRVQSGRHENGFYSRQPQHLHNGHQDWEEHQDSGWSSPDSLVCGVSSHI